MVPGLYALNILGVNDFMRIQLIEVFLHPLERADGLEAAAAEQFEADHGAVCGAGDSFKGRIDAQEHFSIGMVESASGLRPSAAKPCNCSLERCEKARCRRAMLVSLTPEPISRLALSELAPNCSA